ncbi:hypothetical protein GXP71_12725 [Cellulomonas sp. H30R-01]|uniref:hypothetical protein n=1 Tax=Cellulomonas sp. H30R-01 TaxID=2704467 RepID=UPI00138C1220|nr:hypothetical protein [Cellulomonas sp. H30R-01]QHT56856.1 hypothetical protein GXP71_12725 [Cellulomonas sp. H30R-01]
MDWDEIGRLTRSGDWDAVRAAADECWVARDMDETALQHALAGTLLEAVARAAAEGDVVALYFEVDDGRTGVFLAHSFLPDDDWPADFTHWVDGPAVPEDDDDRDAIGCVTFAALGRAIASLPSPIELPIGMGLHDGEVLYAPLPQGVMAPEDVPMTRVPDEPSGWYRLQPARTDLMKHARVASTDERARAFQKRLGLWASYHRPEPLPLPQGDPFVFRLVRGSLDDVVITDSLGCLYSDRLVAALRGLAGPNDRIFSQAVLVESADGSEQHIYHACRAKHLVRSVATGGRTVLRSSDLAGARVVDELTQYYRPQGLAMVSDDVLGALSRAGVLVGLAAVPVTTVDEDEHLS